MGANTEDDGPPCDEGALKRRIIELEAALADQRALVQELERSEERFRALLENSPDAISVVDVEGTLLYVNRAIPPRKVGDLIGTSALSYMSPEHAVRFREALREVVATGTSRTIEVQTDGRLWWETRLVPRKQDSRVTAVMGIGTEITQRRMAEAALRRSEEKMRVASQAAGMGMWAWEPDEDVLMLDAAAAAMLGLPHEETWTSFQEVLPRVHPEDQGRVEAAVRAFAETGVLDELEGRVAVVDGSARWLVTSGKRVEDDPYGTRRFIGGMFDVTERKRLEEHVRQVQKMEAVGQLTAGMAHNFNNLLTAIIPSIQLTRREVSAVSASRLQDAEYAAFRAAELVKQLMVFSRHHRPVDSRAVDVRELLHRTVSICRATFDRSIEIEIVDGICIPPVAGDGGQLEQVFLNICLNARDALETVEAGSRRIRIALDLASGDGGAGSPGDHVRVRISDNGSGMTEEVRRRVFEPFFTTKDVGRGSGLGLATAYAITSDHGGRIACDSSVGSGTTFTILLPVAGDAVAPAVVKAREGLRGDETVLVIDDERLVRSAVRSVLEPQGYTVLEANDGPGGFELFQREQEQIDVVLLDLSMPGIPGEAVLANILRERPRARVILFTGYRPPSPPPGAVAILQKPFDLEELLRIVRDVCDRTSAG